MMCEPRNYTIRSGTRPKSSRAHMVPFARPTRRILLLASAGQGRIESRRSLMHRRIRIANVTARP